jgi:hypothetical protein
MWQQKTFDHQHDWRLNFLIIIGLATKNIPSPIVWQLKFFGHHTTSDQKKSIATRLAIKIFQLP